jgi:hypothetical protein
MFTLALLFAACSAGVAAGRDIPGAAEIKREFALMDRHWRCGHDMSDGQLEPR